jgi:RNA polymerase sigma-70 factor (ECF subfamily)
VAAYLFRVTGRTTAAADLAHETFVQLYLARQRYRPTAAFSTYLFGIAANLARQHHRRLARHPSVAQSPETNAQLPEMADPTLLPDAALQVREQISAVEKAILALPPDLRETLTLFVHEEMSYTEIAHIVGGTPKAVETRIYRARRLLKESLKNL